MTKIRSWLIQLIAGDMAVALNIQAPSITILAPHGLVANCKTGL